MYKTKLIETQLFVDNEYLSKYVELVNLNINNDRVMFKTTAHHIIPKYCFEYLNMPVDNSTLNTVHLSYSDHVIAHFYLAECCVQETHKLFNYAAMYNISGNKFSDISCVDKILYSKGFKEEFNSLKEVAAREAQRRGKEQIPYIRTEETLKKLSDKLTGYIHIHKDNIRKMIPPEEFDRYEHQGWKRGRGISSMSEEGKQRFREKRLGHAVSEETREKIRQARAKQVAEKGEPAAGHKMSETSKQQMREKLKHKVAITDGLTELRVDVSVLDEYLAKGFREGRPRRAWINNGSESKQVLIDALDRYLKDGWHKGRGKLKGET